MGWIEPKTDWDPTKDRLNPESYNRIRNNLAVLGELVNEIYAPLTLESMGEELVYLERSRFCDADPMEYLLMQDFIDTVRNERLADALRRLTKRQQLIIELHYWKGYKLREIAVILGCAPNTVSQVLAHARHALKRAMTK